MGIFTCFGNGLTGIDNGGYCSIHPCGRPWGHRTLARAWRGHGTGVARACPGTPALPRRLLAAERVRAHGYSGAEPVRLFRVHSTDTRIHRLLPPHLLHELAITCPGRNPRNAFLKRRTHPGPPLLCFPQHPRRPGRARLP
eukprot:gene12250-biopygen14001